MKETIAYGSKEIVFSLDYADRKTLGITVTPEMEVQVKAPAGTTVEQVKEMVHKRAGWILKQQNFFLAFHPKAPAKRFVSGETHLYLGRQYQLKVTQGTENVVKLKGKFLEVTCQDEKVKQVVTQWYSAQAHRKYKEYATPWIERFKKYEVTPSAMVIRDMPTRWGSCTPKGKIILNPELIKAPRGCIEYVIVHELCHLIHHDHTQNFIDLQTKEMPSWEKWKTKLEKLLA